MTGYKSLADISVGDSVRVKEIGESSLIRRRLLDLGFVSGTRLECVGKSPLGDPLAFLVRGAVIAIRKTDCKDISVYF